MVGDRAITGRAASASQMGRFETEWLTRPRTLAALTDLTGQWIDTGASAATAEDVVLDIGFEREPELWPSRRVSAYNGHFGCTCFKRALDGVGEGAANISAISVASRQIGWSAHLSLSMTLLSRCGRAAPSGRSPSSSRGSRRRYGRTLRAATFEDNGSLSAGPGAELIKNPGRSIDGTFADGLKFPFRPRFPSGLTNSII